jgi:hypothetical protein
MQLQQVQQGVVVLIRQAPRAECAEAAAALTATGARIRGIRANYGR